MGYRIQTLVVILGMLAGLLAPDLPPVRAGSPNNFIVTNLTPIWTTGIIGGEGVAKIVVTDLNQDGKTEIASCSFQNIYVLHHTLTNSYDTIWYSENISCKKITSADRDANGVGELYVATDDKRVVIFDGDDFQLLGSFALPGSSSANDIEAADVDGDGALEIIVVRSEDTLVYNANTFSLEWRAAGLGGNQVAIGNIDNDALLEIVVNGSPAHILDAQKKIEEWNYSEGFGISMDVGDVDGDNRAEIAYIKEWYNAGVMDGDTQTTKWARSDFGNLSAVKVADLDGDGNGEVIIGDNQWGCVTGYRGSDGTKLWSIQNPGYGVDGLEVGDADNDGVIEIVWGTGFGYSGEVVMYVGSWVNQTIEWSSEDLDGPLSVAAGDIDNDSQGEIIMASNSSNSGHGNGILRIYDGATLQPEWSSDYYNSLYDEPHLLVNQLDSDAALEILVGGSASNRPRLKVYDGLSHIVEWESPDMGSGSSHALAVKNLDADVVDEIVIGLSNQHVQVLNGASSVIQWDSGNLAGAIRDLALGDLDGDAVIDLAVLTDRGVFIYNTLTWTSKPFQPVTSGRHLTIISADQSQAGKLLLLTSDVDSNWTLQVWNGTTYAIDLQRSLGRVTITDMVTADMDSDGVTEFVLMGSTEFDWRGSSLFWIGSLSYPFLWEYKMNGRYLGVINSLALCDFDNDGKVELLLGSGYLIQVNEITTTLPTIHYAYLSPVYKPKPPRGLYGTVRLNGSPAPGAPLDLRFYNGTSWSTLAVAGTALDGSYSFANIPSLSPGQYYYVRFQNFPNGNPNRLWTWHTRSVGTFFAGTDVHLGDFELENIALGAPANGATISLPYTFKWTRRPYSPSDSYEFDLYDPMDGNPFFYTEPLLGHSSSYTLNSLPQGFSPGAIYAWEVWVYSPDGGYGISYESRLVYFANTGLTSQPDAQSTEARNRLDLENRPLR